MIAFQIPPAMMYKPAVVRMNSSLPLNIVARGSSVSLGIVVRGATAGVVSHGEGRVRLRSQDGSKTALR